MVEDKPKSLFWENIIRAAEGEPHEAKNLRGASGFSHPVVALGIDESRRRAIIISGEGDARSAAMAQGDIQGALPKIKVLMVRPVAINLGVAAKLLTQAIGRFEFRQSDLEWLGQHSKEFQERSKDFVDAVADKVKGIFIPSISAVPLNLIGIIKDAIQQLSLIQIHPTEKIEVEEKTKTKTGVLPTFDFGRLALLDPVEADRLMGVCSIPLYELSPEEIERLKGHKSVEEAREILRRHDILQYFFPAADQLTLGLLDREPVSAEKIIYRLRQTPKLGHPFGPFEVIQPSIPLNEVIDALQQQGFVAEGEAIYEVTPEGRSVRAKVSFKPREGLVSKLLQQFSFKVDLSLKDFFK